MRTVTQVAAVHALHDPTEGGLAAAVHELAAAADSGAVIYAEKVPVLPEAKLLCDFFDLDPLGTLASGALLCAVPPASVERILHACEEKGWPVGDIGKLVSAQEGVTVIEEGQRRPVPLRSRDEILKIFV